MLLIGIGDLINAEDIILTKSIFSFPGYDLAYKNIGII